MNGTSIKINKKQNKIGTSQVSIQSPGPKTQTTAHNNEYLEIHVLK